MDSPHTVPELQHSTAVSQQDVAVVEQDDGVTRIEALYLVFSQGWKLYLLYGSLAIIAFVYALSESTTYTYENYAASSFESHPLIGTISVVTSIMGGVAKPFIAKFSDLSGRPSALALAVGLYAIGYIVVAASRTIGAVAGGQVIYTMGNTGIDLVLSILLSDITSLQWRGFVQGLFSMPFVITAFVAGDISADISANTVNGWRWGYGMFIILVPVCLAPAFGILFWADRKAKKIGVLSLADSSYSRRRQISGEKEEETRHPLHLVLHYWRVMDGFGLLVLGTSFTLILLPFTLYTTAQHGWKNPSLIAMFVVGGLLFVAFFGWEFKIASHPIMPRRLVNKTFLCCVVIDFMYYLSGYITLTYFTSWVYVVKDWNLTDYTYFTNTLTVGLCLFGLVGGIIQRYTHRYKWIQLAGLSIRIIGQGLVFLAANGNQSDAVLVMSQVLTSMGGGFSVVGSQVATQASVPHQDMALAISLLSLWTSVGGGIGSAIAAAIWNDKLPANLNKYLGGILNATQIDEIYGSIIVARQAEPRDLVIEAYNHTAFYMFLPALILSFLPLIAGIMTSNYYLGDTHNAVENKVIRVQKTQELAEIDSAHEEKV